MSLWMNYLFNVHFVQSTKTASQKITSPSLSSSIEFGSSANRITQHQNSIRSWIPGLGHFPECQTDTDHHQLWQLCWSLLPAKQTSTVLRYGSKDFFIKKACFMKRGFCNKRLFQFWFFCKRIFIFTKMWKPWTGILPQKRSICQ